MGDRARKAVAGGPGYSASCLTTENRHRVFTTHISAHGRRPRRMRGRKADPFLSMCQPRSPGMAAACSRASVPVVTEAGPKAGRWFENMVFSSLKLSWKYPACQQQRPMLSPHVAPSPGGLPNHLAKITLDVFHHGGGSDSPDINLISLPEMLLSLPTVVDLQDALSVTMMS